MPLTQDQANKMIDWLSSKGVNTCPACQKSRFTDTKFGISEIISAPIVEGNNINLGGPNVPMVQVICENCSHVMLFAAVPIGVIK